MRKHSTVDSKRTHSNSVVETKFNHGRDTEQSHNTSMSNTVSRGK